ncbi:hypothetical protein [Lacrimispora indolis]|uniref:hypothetical protein n=1 Tax=Lacrimispora indolis TaxID=69825 RepID=UPI00041A0DE2|nr:hypothetical protein [[Clostridium] methoxybenzovorans]
MKLFENQNKKSKPETMNKKQRTIERIIQKLLSANTEQLKDLDVFIQYYLMRKE